MILRVLIVFFSIVLNINATESQIIKEKEFDDLKMAEIEEKFKALNHSPGACLVRYVEAYRHIFIKHCEENKLHHSGPAVKTDKGYKTVVIGGGCQHMSMSSSVLHTAVKEKLLEVCKNGHRFDESDK